MNHSARLFFSFRSPFSWMAIERLLGAVPNAHDVMEFIPYWEPDAKTEAALTRAGAALHYVPMSRAKHLYILQDTKRLAAQLGMQMAWPVDINPWWELPHLGYLKARELGSGIAFYTAVTSARWNHGENICDREVIRRIAASIGLDGDLILSAPDDPDMRSAGVRCLARAYEDDIFGVPFFRYQRHRFWGFDRVDAFLSVFRDKDKTDEELAGGVPIEITANVGSYDSDTAGGCG